MRAPDHRPNSRDHASVAMREAAFGIIELIVVMVIVAILMAVAVSTFSGAKEATRTKEAHAAASAYEEAIARFQKDNANKVPADGDMIQVTGKEAGPKTLVDPTKAYLTRIPDGVVAGRIGVSMDGANCGTTPATPTGAGVATTTAWVSYCPEAAPGYGIRAVTRPNTGAPWTVAGGAKVCWRGNTVRQPRCGG